MNGSSQLKGVRGFSLVELLVATAVFLIVSAAALSLFTSHLPLFAEQQNQAGLNIQMRNAVSQMQLDVANAGSGYYQGINIPDFPIGVTIVNNVATSSTPCNTPSTFTYGTNCFDQLNVISIDASTPPAHPTDSTGTTCVSTTSSTIFASPLGSTTAAQLAADYHNGDEVLLVTANGSQISSAILTQDGSVAGGKVKLQHNGSASNGTFADPAGVSTNANNKLGTNFCGTDWVLKMNPISYYVSTATPSDPQLVRQQPSGSGTPVLLADQIIGFKVGAILWNNCVTTCTSDDESTYNYDSSTYVSGGNAQAYNYSLIRSVQIEMIGRTVPNFAPTYVFRNSFDSGPYQIESSSTVLNPRNLSMNNQ